MCGLSGYVELSSAASSYDRGETLRRMTRKLAHRGPDAEGYFQQGPAYLGHRRLSVIDIAASIQPMSTADGRHTLQQSAAGLRRPHDLIVKFRFHQ